MKKGGESLACHVVCLQVGQVESKTLGATALRAVWIQVTYCLDEKADSETIAGRPSENRVGAAGTKKHSLSDWIFGEGLNR